MKIADSTIKALVKDYIQNNAEFPREKDMKVSFDVKGEVVAKQGDDYTQVIDHTIPYAELLTLALSKLNGVTVESLLKDYLSRMDDETFKAELGESKDKAKEAMRSLKGKAERKCRGKVTFDELSGDGEISECEIC